MNPEEQAKFIENYRILNITLLINELFKAEVITKEQMKELINETFKKEIRRMVCSECKTKFDCVCQLREVF